MISSNKSNFHRAAAAVVLTAGCYAGCADSAGSNQTDAPELNQTPDSVPPTTEGVAGDAGAVTPAELTQLNTDINSALTGLVPDRRYMYCTNGIPFGVPNPPVLDAIGCRTVIFYKDAQGVPVLENNNPNDDIIMDGFASGQRQVCATSYFWRNGRTLPSGDPSWTVAADDLCNGTANVVIDSLEPLNRDVRITLSPDPATGATFPIVHELRTIRLEPNGTGTVLRSSFRFGEAEVFLRNFTKDDSGAETTTKEIHYYRTRPELLPQ